MQLSDLGWNAHFARFFEQILENPGDDRLVPARVVRQDRDSYRILTETGEHRAHLSGRLRRAAFMNVRQVRAVVTGGAGGIGKAIVWALSAVTVRANPVC